MATSDRPTVVGVFENRGDAERAVDALHRAGFRDDQVGFAAKGEQAPEGGRAIEGTGTGEAGEGAAKGAVTGGVIGGILGALATGLIPGIGPVIAGGLLAGILGGVAVGAAAGGLFGALVGSMDVPEEEARYYDDEFRSGRTVVTVKADGRYAEARAILQNAGAYDFESRGVRTETATAGMAETARRPADRARMTEGERTVELREERLQPRKEMQQTGEVGLRKEVVSEQQTIDVPVTREEVVVERHAVEPRPADRPIGEGQTIDVPVREERVEVTKQPMVYEEVEVSKRQVQDTQKVSGTVRREEIRGEREGEVNVRSDEGGVSGFRGWDEVESTSRQDWERRHGASGMRWHDVEPYRRYGYEMSHDQRYRDRDWPDVEPHLRADYADWSRRHGYSGDESAWDRFKEQVRDAWNQTRETVRGDGGRR